MVRIKADWNRLYFQDIRGNLRLIEGCPLSRVEELQDLFALLYEEVDEAGDEFPTFKSLYLERQTVRSICKAILELHGLKESWLDLERLIALIFCRQDEKGEFLPGLLLQLNGLTDKKESESASLEGKQTHLEALAIMVSNLINLELAKDAESALNLINSTPADKLEAIVESRIAATDKKSAKRRGLTAVRGESKAAIRKLMQEMKMQGGPHAPPTPHGSKVA